MIRSVATIALAIQIAQPKVTDADAERYAVVLQKEAKAHDFDPLTGVSIISHESAFNPKVVSKNGEDHGLAQIRARYIGACKNTSDPIKNPTPACEKVKQMLLEPEENIRVMAELITRHRKFCKKKVGSARFDRWLASYQGRNYPKKKRWCKPGKGTWKVINYRRHLIAELSRRGKLHARR